MNTADLFLFSTYLTLFVSYFIMYIGSHFTDKKESVFLFFGVLFGIVCNAALVGFGGDSLLPEFLLSYPLSTAGNLSVVFFSEFCLRFFPVSKKRSRATFFILRVISLFGLFFTLISLVFRQGHEILSAFYSSFAIITLVFASVDSWKKTKSNRGFVFLFIHAATILSTLFLNSKFLAVDKVQLNFRRPYELTVGLFLGGILSLIYYCYLLRCGYNQRKKSESQLANLNLIKWSNLQSKLEPHLLKNLMNQLMSDKSLDSLEIQQVTLLTSEYFRLTGKMLDSYGVSTLSDEIELASIYSDLQMARFEDELTIDIRLDPEGLKTSSSVLPTFTMQVLLENAVIHGFEKELIRPFYIRLNVRSISDYYILEICQNTDQRTEKMKYNCPKHGGGLDTLTKMLEILFQTDYNLTFEKDTSNLCVQLKFPEIKKSEPLLL